MKFFSKSKVLDKSKQTILFVCVENAGRSQMAEGFFRKHAPKNLEAISAGTRPVGEINPIAVEVMKEVGVDISKRPKILTEDMVKHSSIKVNMGCIEKESCPTLFIHNVLDWNIGPKEQTDMEGKRDQRYH